jgi:hypothetical protein
VKDVTALHKFVLQFKDKLHDEDSAKAQRTVMRSATLTPSCEDLNEASTLAEIQRLLLMDDRLQSLSPESSSHFNASLHQFALFNFSLDEALRILMNEKQREDRDLGGHAEVALIIVYALLMVAGLVTNLLVSFVVARRAQMHTARNLYIVNLTVSDITLCVICMPSTLVAILRYVICHLSSTAVYSEIHTKHINTVRTAQ